MTKHYILIEIYKCIEQYDVVVVSRRSRLPSIKKIYNYFYVLCLIKEVKNKLKKNLTNELTFKINHFNSLQMNGQSKICCFLLRLNLILWLFSVLLRTWGQPIFFINKNCWKHIPNFLGFTFFNLILVSNQVLDFWLSYMCAW